MNKKISCILILCSVALLLGTVGCSTAPRVVATVNGVEISGEEYQRALNGFLSGYGLTEETMATTMGLEETVDYKNSVIDEMVLQELMLQYAADSGLDTLSAEDQEDIEEKVTSYLKGLRESFAADVETEGTLQGDAAAHEAEQRYDEYIRTYSYTEENLSEQFRRQLILDRVYEDVMAGCTVSDAEVQAYYDDEVAAQKDAEKEDPDDLYQTYIKEIEGSGTPVYVPAEASKKARYVKHILLQIPSDVSAEISEKEASGDDAGAEELRGAAMKELRSQANAILQEARKGANFDSLIEKYNEDPGVLYNPDGYLVYDGAAFDKDFLEAAMALKNVGDITPQPVESASGYHVIQFAAVPTAGAVPFADVKEEIAASLNESKRKEYWAEAVKAWQEEAAIEKHEFRSE